MSELQNEIMSTIMNMQNKSKPISFLDSMEDQQTKIIDCAKDSRAINDAYGNSLLSVGTDDKASMFDKFTFENTTLAWPLWSALYSSSWVFKRAIDKPAQDEIKSGITLIGDYEKDNIYRVLKNYRDDMIQLLQWGALFGGSVAVMMFDNFDEKDYLSPIKINLKKVKTAKVMKMYVVDRWYGVAPDYDKTVTKMTDIDYGKPKFYTITMTNGKSYRFHHDYVIRYEHRTAPKLIKNGMLQGWGYAEGTHIINELVRDEKLKASIQSLMDKSLIEVIQMDGMRGVFMGADNENEMQLRKRLEMVNWGRSYNSLTFLDKNDEYHMNTFSGLSGLADLLEQNMWLISSALEMQGILFGELKGGLSQETDAMERYDNVINGRCESFVRPCYEKLLKTLFLMYDINEKVEFTFNSLISSKQDKERIEGIKNFTDLCSTLLGDGVITTKQYAKALQTYTINGSVDFGLTDDVIDKMDESFMNQFEGITEPIEGDMNEGNDR